MNFLHTEEARIHAAYQRRTAADERYSWFDDGQLFRVQQLERQILATLRRHGLDPLDPRRILEVGCGTGHWLRQFIQWGAKPEKVTGVDLLEGRIAQAKSLCPANVEIHRANAESLNFADGTFDLVFQATVFTSILDADLKQRVAAEMRRVVKSEGLILWYDYHVNNPWNKDVRAVKRKEIYQLFPNCRIDLKRITLAPPLARALAPYSYLTCYLLEKLPPLCTHYLGVIRKG